MTPMRHDHSTRFRHSVGIWSPGCWIRSHGFSVGLVRFRLPGTPMPRDKSPKSAEPPGRPDGRAPPTAGRAATGCACCAASSGVESVLSAISAFSRRQDTLGSVHATWTAKLLKVSGFPHPGPWTRPLAAALRNDLAQKTLGRLQQPLLLPHGRCTTT